MIFVMGCDGCCVCDGWMCMNPLRLAALAASPFYLCSTFGAKRGGKVVCFAFLWIPACAGMTVAGIPLREGIPLAPLR